MKGGAVSAFPDATAKGFSPRGGSGSGVRPIPSSREFVHGFEEAAGGSVSHQYCFSSFRGTGQI